MTIHLSAIWGRNANGEAIANYRVREHDDAEDAGLCVLNNGARLVSQGFTFDRQYAQPAWFGTSECVVSVYKNTVGDVRETGYWSQENEAPGQSSSGCEAAYLMCE